MDNIHSYIRLALKYICHNFKTQYEYRTAFWTQVLAMFLNDTIWLVFWLYFFDKFPILASWDRNDVVTMWAVAAAGYGLASGLCANSMMLAGIILRGQLDSWLSYPRLILPHLLLGKTSVSGWGDFIFGVLSYIFFVQPDPFNATLFILLLISVAILVVGFSVLASSLGFFLGSAEILSEQWRFALITFATYPPNLFDGSIKLVLYTLIPAGFCSYLPVEALKHNSIILVCETFAGSLAIFACGVLVFYMGLKRYESGNLLIMKE